MFRGPPPPKCHFSPSDRNAVSDYKHIILYHPYSLKDVDCDEMLNDRPNAISIAYHLHYIGTLNSMLTSAQSVMHKL
jgi:hypothetical protein